MKLLLIFFILAIVTSLGVGLYFLVNYDKGGTRLLTALKIRVALSAVLIAFLVFGYFQGWIAPNA
ncbi:MAG: DUF2909 domain-containing protein [Woeseiaceae bacterium]